MTAGRTNTNQKSKDWCTPPKYVEAISLFFRNQIELDPCSNQFSIVPAKTKFSLPIDGLSKEWNYKTIFVNPPYGNDKEKKTSIKDWICKCYKSHKEYGSEILALIPVATNTRHWKEYIFGKASICFLFDTRLKFMIDGSIDNKGAPMACAMVYWGNDLNKFSEIFSAYGFVCR